MTRLTPLSSRFTADRKSNNFDALRLFGAFLVFYSHAFALFGRGEPVFVARAGFKTISAGAVGVTIFFVISGFLIPASWENGKRVIPYLFKRAVRIYPGLAVNFIIVYALIVPFFCAVPPEKYFKEVIFSVEWFFRLTKNLILMRSADFNVVFSDNPVPYMVNGPLWTLPYEFVMYLTVLVAGLTTGFKKYFFVIPLFFFVYLYLFVSLPVTEGELAIYFAGGFVSGTSLYVFRGIIPYSRALFLFCLLLLLGLAIGGFYLLPLYLTALSYVVIYVAFLKIPKLNGVGKFGDFSFGVYIYGWPVQQVFVMTFIKAGMFWTYALVSFVVTLVFAFFSWRLVESPALKLKKHFRVSEEPAVR